MRLHHIWSHSVLDFRMRLTMRQTGRDASKAETSGYNLLYQAMYRLGVCMSRPYLAQKVRNKCIVAAYQLDASRGEQLRATKVRTWDNREPRFKAQRTRSEYVPKSLLLLSCRCLIFAYINDNTRCRKPERPRGLSYMFWCIQSLLFCACDPHLLGQISLVQNR